MKSQITFFHCGEQLKRTLSLEIDEINSIVQSINWSPAFSFESLKSILEHQTGYNKAFDYYFSNLNWESQPLLRTEPKLIGDFRKGLVFVEIQFGNSASLYRDYYKFQYGLANGLLSLAVLIVPMNANAFFPSRIESVRNMADFTLANKCLSVLPINVPTMLIGLMPEN